VVIKGVGIDIVSLKRIEKLLTTYGDKFIERVLSKEEIEELKKRTNKVEFISGRFAVKEAIIKVLDKSVPFKYLSVVQSENGKISLKGFNDIFISISHEKEFAVGFALRVLI